MTGSERPSPEPLLKKEASPAVLAGGRENSGFMLWKPSNHALNHRAWGDPSRTLEGNSSRKALRAFPDCFWNFLRKVPAVVGH